MNAVLCFPVWVWKHVKWSFLFFLRGEDKFLLEKSPQRTSASLHIITGASRTFANSRLKQIKYAIFCMFLKFLAIVKEKIVVNPWSGPACDADLAASYGYSRTRSESWLLEHPISASIVAVLLGVLNPDVSQSEEH